MGDKKRLFWFRAESQQMDLCDSCLPPVPQWEGGDKSFFTSTTGEGKTTEVEDRSMLPEHGEGRGLNRTR